MNKENSARIIKILIIVFIIVILIIAGLFVFLATDLFKSNKTLFAKYTLELFGKNDSFIENNVFEYYKKIAETPFENQSTVSFSTSQEGQELVNQLNIILNGKVDLKNMSAEEGVSINYSPEVTLPVTIRYKDNLFGYQTEYVGSKYIVDDRSQTSTLSVTNENNEEEQMIAKEDISNLVKKYGEIVLNQLSDDKFSKDNNEGSTIYKVTLNGTDINNMINAICEALSQDQETIDKFGLDIDSINQYAKDVQNDNIDEETNIEIALYKNSGDITKIELKSEEIIVSLEKTLQNGNLQYKVILSKEDTNSTKNNVKIELDLSFAGLTTLQNVENNYLLNFNMSNNGEEKNIITYNINNTINFIDNIDIESFDDSNAVIYSKYDETQIDSFAQAVDERWQQVNQMQMEQLGISEEENPIVQAIVTPVFSMLLYTQASDTVNNVSLQTQQDLTQQVDVNSFNQKFELYEGTNIQGTTVRGLLTTISNNNGIQSGDTTTQQNNNTSSSYKIKEINFNGEEYEVNQQNIAAIKEEVVAENYYRVEFERDPNTGLIYRAVINPK